MQAEEALWTEIIRKYGGKQANWVPDLVGRAYGNRGNSRSRQGKLAPALADYNAAAALWPWSVGERAGEGRSLGGRSAGWMRNCRLLLIADSRSPSQLPPSPSLNTDPILNRGVVLEALGRFPEAVADYRAVLAVAPDDPAAWNNLGNATAGLGDYKAAAEYYGKAAQLAPQFSFAQARARGGEGASPARAS